MKIPSSPVVATEEKQESYKMFNGIAHRYDFLNHLLSMGVDILWRKKLVRRLPHSSPASLQVLDLATGTADVAIELSGHPAVKQVLGMDLSQEMLHHGQLKISKKRLEQKIQLQCGDAVTIPCADESFDCVTLSFGIRNFPDPYRSLQNIFRVLRPGGKVIVMEFALPQNSFFRPLYLFYLRHILPPLGNLLSGDDRAYRYLNQTIEQFPHGQHFVNWLDQVGFEQSSFTPLSGGIAGLYTAVKPGVKTK